MLGTCWIQEPVGPSTCHILAPERWLTALCLCACKTLTGVVFRLGDKRPVARQNRLGRGGTRSIVSAAFKCVTCGELVATLIEGIHRILTVPNADGIIIFPYEACCTSDRLALLDAALLICAKTIFADVLSILWFWVPVGPSTRHILAPDRRLTTLFLFAGETLTGYALRCSFRSPGSIAAVSIACREFVATLITVTLPNTNCAVVFTQEACTTFD